MQEQESKSAFIKIHWEVVRPKSGYFAKVHINDLVISLPQAEEQTFAVRSGLVNLRVGNGQKLSFTITENEVREFKIKKATNDWRFMVKYSFLMIMMLLLTFFIIRDAIKGKSVFVSVAILLLGIWSIQSEFRKEQLIIEEK